MFTLQLFDMKGGYRENAGRKSKAEEQKLIERLTPMADKAHQKLHEAIERGDQWAVRLFFEYYYGKPFQRMDITTNDQSISQPPVITTLSQEEFMKVIKT